MIRFKCWVIIMSEEERPVIRYDEKIDNKGRKYWKPVFLTTTPDEEILRLNKMFPAGGR
jgi:hypothetical protein